MTMGSQAQQAPSTLLQGVVVPTSSINPAEFFARTRRLRFQQYTAGSFAGLGQTDNIVIRQAGIIGALIVRFVGTVTIALPTGTAATTSRWPYDLIRALRFSANGQSNLINCSGAKLAARRFMAVGDLDDGGVSRGMGGASPGTAVQNGTLSLASESWGLGQNVTAIPAAVYNVDLTWHVPIAWDQVKLVGAIFAQTAATSLELGIDWAPASDLFALTGTATAVVAGALTVDGIVYSIPVGPNGDIVVPNLSVFHSMVQANNYAIGQGPNEPLLPGTGVGRQLMRVMWQLWEGAGAASAPLAINDANFGVLGWRYGGNDTPEAWSSGQMLRYHNNGLYSTDVGLQGFASLDFASQWAFRDSVDEGATSNLRLLINRVGAPTSPRLEMCQETLFAGAAGA